jgi:hypothetical protein
MAFSKTIPSVLQLEKPLNSISIERVLNTARNLLLEANFENEADEENSMACVENLETIIKHLDR